MHVVGYSRAVAAPWQVPNRALRLSRAVHTKLAEHDCGVGRPQGSTGRSGHCSRRYPDYPWAWTG